MRRWRRALLALVAGAALVLAGCASIPRSSDVSDGRVIGTQAKGFDAFNYIPSDPAPGAGQEEILRGFIKAALSPQGRYAIARKFLTPALASHWSPEASVTVDSASDRSYHRHSDDSWSLTVTPTAFVDDAGAYRQADSDSPITQTFTFRKVGGEWRIAKAPDGTIVDALSFDNVFSAHTLYFFDPGYRYLVPDERWFPTRVSTPTRITNALLAGPSPWLSGAVATAFPQGTKLAVDSVTVSGTTAQVDLSSAANGATRTGMERMRLQLTQSLASPGTISRVALSVEGTRKDVGELGGSAPLQDPNVDARPLVLRKGRFGFLSSSSLEAIPVISKAVEEEKPSAVVLSADHKTAALLTSTGVVAVRAGEDDPTQLIDARDGLIAPSLDVDGYVWSVPGARAGALDVTGPDGVRHPIQNAWSGSRTIAALAVSRDGTRLVALLGTGDRMQLVAAAIVRDGHGAPVRVGTPFKLASLPKAADLSLAWTDELDVAVLSTDPSGESTIVSQRIGGESRKSSGPAHGVAIAGGSGVPPYWVLTSDGSLRASRETGWQERIGGVALLATQRGLP